MQMPTIETRVASLEAVQAQINERLGDMRQELHDMRQEFSQELRDMRQEFSQELRDIRAGARQNTRWMFGVLVTVLIANVGTAISIIVALSRQ